jgi:hypothetical protein
MDCVSTIAAAAALSSVTCQRNRCGSGVHNQQTVRLQSCANSLGLTPNAPADPTRPTIIEPAVSLCHHAGLTVAASLVSGPAGCVHAGGPPRAVSHDHARLRCLGSGARYEVGARVGAAPSRRTQARGRGGRGGRGGRDKGPDEPFVTATAIAAAPPATSATSATSTAALPATSTAATSSGRSTAVAAAAALSAAAALTAAALTAATLAPAAATAAARLCAL